MTGTSLSLSAFSAVFPSQGPDVRPISDRLYVRALGWNPGLEPGRRPLTEGWSPGTVPGEGQLGYRAGDGLGRHLADGSF